MHTLRNGIVRAESVAESMYASIDLVCDKVNQLMSLNCSCIQGNVVVIPG